MYIKKNQSVVFENFSLVDKQSAKFKKRYKLVGWGPKLFYYSLKNGEGWKNVSLYQ